MLKILILRLSAIGDTIHTLPLVNALKAKYPDCKIGWVVEDKASLFVEGHQNVDKCYIIPKKIWKKRGLSLKNVKEFLKIIDSINQEKYDIVLDTQQLFKSAILLPFLNIKRKITLSGGREFSGLFSNEIIKAKHPLFDPDYHVVKRNLEFAQYLGVEASEPEFKLPSASQEHFHKVQMLLSSLNLAQKTVVISPATTWENKHWDENCWQKVVNYLNGKTNLVFTGTKQDLPLIKRISSSVQNSLILAGQTDLMELAEVFRKADIVISPDSGSAHIAWAVEKPFVITIFTATAAKRNAPSGKNCVCFYPDIDCYPCMKRKCRLKNDKNLCCRSVQADKIIEKLQELLS